MDAIKNTVEDWSWRFKSYICIINRAIIIIWLLLNVELNNIVPPVFFIYGQLNNSIFHFPVWISWHCSSQQLMPSLSAIFEVSTSKMPVLLTGIQRADHLERASPWRCNFYNTYIIVISALETALQAYLSMN